MIYSVDLIPQLSFNPLSLLVHVVGGNHSDIGHPLKAISTSKPVEPDNKADVLSTLRTSVLTLDSNTAIQLVTKGHTSSSSSSFCLNLLS